ncbi:MAG: IS481 family transposase [Candidatus Acidiferrum sp.]
MDIHKNARLSFRSRESLAKFVIDQGATRKAAAAAFRVSAKTAAKWIVRFRVAGLDGLLDRSSRPHRSPRRLPDSLADQVVQLRRQRLPGYLIAHRTGLSPASVSRILRRARLSRWRDLDPPPPVQRYEHPVPGDLLHLDIKGMTRFSEVRRRADGRLRGKQKHPGFLALHVAIDDHSRIAFTQMLPDQKAETTIGFLHAAIEFFATHRISIRALLTDNGSCYRSAPFRQACSRMHIKHHRTRPYTPRTNGKAERFIQTALREWAYSQHWPNSDQRDLKLQLWTDYYNHQRPHGSLNYMPPISRSGDGTTS